MQKALWLTTLAFVATAVAAVTMAEYGHQNPHTVMGRMVRTLKGNPEAPAPTASMAMMGSPMVNLGEVDDRAALRDLKILAMASYEPSPARGQRLEDFGDELTQPVVPAKKLSRIQEEEDGCCLCKSMGMHLSHRCAMVQLKLCDFRRAISTVCDAAVACHDGEMRQATAKACACVAQECCPPPCGFWQFIDEDGMPGCCEQKVSKPTKACCCPAACTPQKVTKPASCCPFQAQTVAKPASCCPCQTQKVIVLERRQETPAVTPKVHFRIVTDGNSNEVKGVNGIQIEIELRLGTNGEVKAKAIKKASCEGCCSPEVSKKCGEGCCSEACPACPATKIMKEATGCKCGKACKCGAGKTTETKVKPEEPATCPGCCSEKKKTSFVEPTRFDPALQQAGYVGAAMASKKTLRLMTRMVPVGDLVDAGTNEEQLVDLCMKMVCPETWQENGGDGQLVYYAPGRCLIARQTEAVMEELETYVDTMRAQIKPVLPPDNKEEGTYWLPFFGTEPVKLDLVPTVPAILELVPITPLDPAVPGFIPAPSTPEKLPNCCPPKGPTGAVPSQSTRQETAHLLLQLLVPYYSFEQWVE